MVGHARLACDEAGHWLGGLARVEQVGQRGEVKVAASENRTLSESVRASGEFWYGCVSGVVFFLKVNAGVGGCSDGARRKTRKKLPWGRGG